MLLFGVLLAVAIDIDNGRQLLVDDFLIAETNGIVRHWNRPLKVERPVLRPAFATDSGLWWDPRIGKYRLWYEKEWAGDLRYAESADGLSWTFPDLGIVKGTNRIFSEDGRQTYLDSWSVVPDYAAADPYANWRMLVSAPGGHTADTLYSSADGVRFERLGVAGLSGDRSTLYYDALRGRWVFSLRDYWRGRSRRRFEMTDFRVPERPYGNWYKDAPTGSVTAVKWDLTEGGNLYSFDAVAYESVMLGCFEMLRNTPKDNADSDRAGLPKQTALHFGFSRDGVRYSFRPEADIEPSGWGSGKWDTGYLSALGGICTVSRDTLRFYYTGVRGDATHARGAKGHGKLMMTHGMYMNGSIGFAELRRDGFAGMVADGAGELVTRPVRFTGSHLFVNAECAFGSVRAEFLDEAGAVIDGFSAADSVPMRGTDETCRELTFKGACVGDLAGRPVSVRFVLQCATLYSFWVSPSARGESRGCVAAGGPDYPGLRDL